MEATFMSKSEISPTAETTLGKLIDGPAGRDAIHMACAPMIADCNLAPGEHVGIVSNGVAGKIRPPVGPPVGIVDPFLKEPVIKGQKFWLVLYPKTVTGIRHHWTHPSFQDELVQPEDPPEAREWIMAFAARWKYSFDDFMAGAREYVRKDYQLDSNWQNQDREETEEDWNTFWNHFHTLTGLSIKDKDKAFVRCCPN